MAQLIIRLLQITCIFVLLLIVAEVSGTVARRYDIRPPSVPLDREGHTAPFYESPLPI